MALYFGSEENFEVTGGEPNIPDACALLARGFKPIDEYFQIGHQIKRREGFLLDPDELFKLLDLPLGFAFPTSADQEIAHPLCQHLECPLLRICSQLVLDGLQTDENGMPQSPDAVSELFPFPAPGIPVTTHTKEEFYMISPPYQYTDVADYWNLPLAK